MANVDNEHGHHKLWECEDDLLELAKTMWLCDEISRIYVYTSIIIYGYYSLHVQVYMHRQEMNMFIQKILIFCH